MSVTIKHVGKERSDVRHTDDFEGTINGKPFRVQTSGDSAPRWYDSELTSDERDEVLSELHARERENWG